MNPSFACDLNVKRERRFLPRSAPFIGTLRNPLALAAFVSLAAEVTNHHWGVDGWCEVNPSVLAESGGKRGKPKGPKASDDATDDPPHRGLGKQRRDPAGQGRRRRREPAGRGGRWGCLRESEGSLQGRSESGFEILHLVDFEASPRQ